MNVDHAYWEYGVFINDKNDPHNGMLWKTFRKRENAEKYMEGAEDKLELKRRQVVKTPWGTVQ